MKFKMWELLGECLLFSMYYINLLSEMDGNGMLEGCKDLHLPLERDLDRIGLRRKNVKKYYTRELK